MVAFQNGDDAIEAFDRFCAFAMEMLDDPAAIQRIETLKRANMTYDQRHFPIANPNHYHKTLHDQLAKVLGPQRYNLMSEGYYRIYLAQRAREERLRTKPTRRAMNQLEDLASIRYQYRQAAERTASRTREASH